MFQYYKEEEAERMCIYAEWDQLLADGKTITGAALGSEFPITMETGLPADVSVPSCTLLHYDEFNDEDNEMMLDTDFISELWYTDPFQPSEELKEKNDTTPIIPRPPVERSHSVIHLADRGELRS